MFCPQCRAEYCPGFTHCSDCDVDLVEHLPESPDRLDVELCDGSLQEVWVGEDQDKCVSICARLKKAGVPFRVIQRSRQFLKGLERSFRIGVPPTLCRIAREIVDAGSVDFTDEAEDQNVMELPGMDSAGLAQRAEDCEGSGDPGSSTIEVWSERSNEYAWIIELSLTENRINARTEVSADGSRKVFVGPRDESRAREIVREIIKGLPPN